ncbi:MAG: MBL fold metallo-hydrolase [bacterium]|nr:MBL fold metallo-hydrolase [bacterium]MDE0288741.1 MBL fold metallo-hydrolase [bacterium]MDE0437262.1 MBL fold metallo-hydrolase [bacterium]
MTPGTPMPGRQRRYPGGMQLTVLGSNGTYPTAGRPASGYLVTEGETTLWMDAGPGTYLALCGEMDPRDLSGVFLSHRHPDHCTDILAFFHALAYGERRIPPVPVLCPKDLAATLGEMVGNSAAWSSTFEFRTLSDGDTFTLGSMKISVARTNHPPPTLAPRINANGRSLTYTADTGPCAALEHHAAGSHVLLAEASLSEPRDNASTPHHMTGLEAGAMASRAGVGRLVLTHIVPYLDPEKSLMEAESTFRGRVSLAVPGARMRV